eukprot:11530731-Alexandrium_andersonii.AAC.1
MPQGRPPLPRGTPRPTIWSSAAPSRAAGRRGPRSQGRTPCPTASSPPRLRCWRPRRRSSPPTPT